MGLSYYDEHAKPRTRLANVWMILNAFIAVGMVFYWSGLSIWLAEPLKWATRDGVGFTPGLFEYPYFMLWSVPVLCVVASWLAIKAKRPGIARIVGSYPTMMLALMVGWYNLAPSHWL